MYEHSLPWNFPQQLSGGSSSWVRMSVVVIQNQLYNGVVSKGLQQGIHSCWLSLESYVNSPLGDERQQGSDGEHCASS